MSSVHGCEPLYVRFLSHFSQNSKLPLIACSFRGNCRWIGHDVPFDRCIWERTNPDVGLCAKREVMPPRAIVLPSGRFLSVVTVATLAQRAIVNEVLDGLMGASSAPNSQNGTGILSKRNRSVLVYPLAPIWVDPWPFFFSGVSPSPGSAPRAAPITPDQATLMLIRALLCLAHAVTCRPT